MDATSESATLARIRWVVALLASVTAAGGLVELAMLRHWEGIQLVPWFVLALVGVVGIVTARGGPPRLAQATGIVALLGGGLGVWQHIAANLALGPQLAQYAQTWESMSALEQWWLASTGAVGAAPALAPGLLAMAGVLLIVAVLDRR
jgi:hypothetical protein